MKIVLSVPHVYTTQVSYINENKNNNNKKATQA